MRVIRYTMILWAVLAVAAIAVIGFVIRSI